jgi:ankyrin repeat protein
MWDGNAHLSSDENALIHVAKETGNCDEVRRFLAAGVGVDIRDGHNMPWDQTPLMLAAHNGFLEIVQILLAAGASVSAVDKNAGESEGEHQPLHHAVLGQNRAIVEAILDAGADINALTDDGNTPLNMAIRRGDLELTQLLVRRGAAVTKFGRKRYRPPVLAVAEAQIPLSLKPAMIGLLLQAGADANATHKFGYTALRPLSVGDDADEENRSACVVALLNAGAKDLPDRDGCTGLHFAIHYRHFRAAMLLIEGGSNINQVGGAVGAPLDWAHQTIKYVQRGLEVAEVPDLRQRLERDLLALDELVEYLKARGAKRRAEMSAAEIAGATASAAPTGLSTAKATSSAPKAKQPPSGAKHFLKLANDGEPEWSLLAVQAPREQVTDALSRRHETAKVLRGVELKKPRKNDELARRLAVIEVKDNTWTVILRTLYHVDESDGDAVAEDAKDLSQQLKTKAISFVAEETSGAVQFDLFENGELVERAQWVDGNSFFIFESTRRKQPKVHEVDDKFADKTFRDLGIYLPACYPRANQRAACLCVEKASAEHVQNADLIELK